MIKRYSDKEIKYLKDNYKSKGNVEIGNIIGRSADSVKSQMQRHNLKRTPKQVLKLKKAFNKGQFKKGSLPNNTNYNGHKRITKDGYIEVRVSSGLYRLEHLYRWELINGNLPESHCLKCLDGNQQNTRPSNWKLISRAENMYRNSKHNYPKEIIPSLVLINQINKKIENYGTK